MTPEIDEDGVEIAGYDVTVDVDDWRSMQAEIERLRAALRELDKAASDVARYGAQPGPQWSNLTIASLKARAALDTRK